MHRDLRACELHIPQAAELAPGGSPTDTAQGSPCLSPPRSY
jgi:hypothetical protein